MPSMRSLALVLSALAVAAPAAAQFKVPKKVKEMTGVEKAKPAAPAAARGEETLVLDDELIDRLIKGLRARDAHKAAAAKEDTPYGRYHKGKAAYAEAKAKCDAAIQAYPSLLAADPKRAEKNGERIEVYSEKMIAAQQKGDTAAQRMWGDSVALLYDPACVVKDPEQPRDFHDQQRAVDEAAEKASHETAGLDGREMGAAVDRAIAILEDQPPPDVSQSEQEAVNKREQELKELMGLAPPPQARTPKPPPAAPAQAGPQPTAGQREMADCAVRNAKKHEKKLAELGQKAAAAGEANDMATAMVYADSINRLQMEGCQQ